MLETAIEIPLWTSSQRSSVCGVRLFHLKIIEESFVEDWFRLGLVELFPGNVLPNPNASDAYSTRMYILALLLSWE